MKITIVTPSIRPNGLLVASSAVVKQDFRDFEWLIGSPFVPKIDSDHVPNFKWVEDDFTGGFWNLNRIYNKMFKEATGDIIVSWQDWVWAPPDGLRKFVDAIESVEKGIVSGVGDQYEKMGKFKPEVKIWSDPRKNLNNGSFYECFPNDAEWNWCAFPREYIVRVGGMDEQLDFLGVGGDQLQVGERWNALGLKSYLDQTNESFTVRHDRSDFGGEKKWNDNHVLFNGMYDQRKRQLMEEEQWPVLSYLK
jgi:hypothetical protein